MIYIVENIAELEGLKRDIICEYEKAIKLHVFYYKDLTEEIEKYGIKANHLIRLYSYNNQQSIQGYEKIEEETELSRWEEFLKSVSDFNFEQYKAIMLADRYDLLVDAAAGTGKTTTIVETVLNTLLKNEANPNEILMMTFTNNSTDDMYKKIYNELEKRYMLTFNSRCLYLIENIKELKICTIHNYFKTVIEQIGFIDGFSQNVKFGVARDKIKQYIEKQVDMRFENAPFNYRDYGIYDLELKDLIYKIVTDGNINISSIEDYVIYSDNDNDEQNNTIKKIIDIVIPICKNINKELIKELIEDDRILLTDLEYRLNNMLKYNFKFNTILTQYKYMFIDECQDTSIYQFKVIKTIKNIINSKVFAVGDSMQAIYRFRSADPNSMNNFTEITDQTIWLRKNYRTEESILKKINSIFGNLDEKFNNLESVKKSGDNRIEKKKANNEELKLNSIEEIIKSNIDRVRVERKKDEKNNHKNRIAILARTNGAAVNLYEKLRERGIHCTLSKGGELFKGKAAKDLLALIRAVLYNENDVAKVQLLNTPYIRLKVDVTAINFLKIYNYKAIIHDYTKEIIKKFNVCYDCSEKNKCKSNCNRLKEQNKKTKISILTDIIYEIKASTEKENDYKSNLLLILEELIKNGCTSTLVDIEQFLDRQIISNNDIKSIEERKANDEVIISTFHATKGLEFDTVILLTDYDYMYKFGERTELLLGEEKVYESPYIHKDVNVNTLGINYVGKKKNVTNYFYTKLLKEEAKKIRKDEINLLYVAFTRAMNKLYVLFPGKIRENTHAELLKKSGYLN